MKRIDKEIAILDELDHPNYNKTFEFTNNIKETYIIIVTEYCENGDLLKYVTKKGFQNEKQLHHNTQGFLDTLKILEYWGIAHGKHSS